MPNLFIDLDTDRFVRENSWCVGLRGINGTEGESLDGFLNVIRSGSLVTPSSLSLSINNADNDYLYNSGTFASGNYFTLPFQSLQLREDLAGRPSTYGLLVAKVNLSGENFSINPLSTLIYANPTGNNTDAIQANLNAHITNVSNPHSVTAAQLGLGNIQTDLNSVSGEINSISDNLNIVSGEVLEIQEYLELIQPFTGVSWTDISGKPLTFSPSAHTHPWGEVTDKPTGFAPVAHTHGWNDVTGKPTGFVMTTGDQLIFGTKYFQDHTYFPDITFAQGTANNDLNANEIYSLYLYERYGSASPVINLASKTLNIGSNTSIDWNSKVLVGQSGNYSLDYLNNQLFTTNQTGWVPDTSLDWRNRQLSGNWLTNTNPTQSGHVINKGYFDFQTGNLYPRSNPSGYITSGQTGQFANAQNVVYITGNQNITGSKKFFGNGSLGQTWLDGNSITVVDTAGVNGYANIATGSLSFLNFSNGIQAILTSDSFRRGVGSPQIIIDFQATGLSGNWSTNTNPTQSGHLVNKGYLESSTNYITQTGNFTAEANRKYLIDTSGAAFTGTLPAAPTIGNHIDFVDARKTWNAKNFTINRNSLLIDGTGENLTCDVRGDRVSLVYQGTEFGWLVLP